MIGHNLYLSWGEKSQRSDSLSHHGASDPLLKTTTLPSIQRITGALVYDLTMPQAPAVYSELTRLSPTLALDVVAKLTRSESQAPLVACPLEHFDVV